MKLMYNFNELVSREVEEAIQKQSKCGLKNLRSWLCHRKEIFRLELTVSITSLRHVGLENAQKQDVFENWNIGWSGYKEVTWRHQIVLDQCI